MIRRYKAHIRFLALALIAASLGVLSRPSVAVAQTYCPGTISVGCIAYYTCNFDTCNHWCYMYGGSSCISWGWNCANDWWNCGANQKWMTCSCYHT